MIRASISLHLSLATTFALAALGGCRVSDPDVAFLPDAGVTKELLELPGALDPLVLSVFARSPTELWLVGGTSGANGGLVAKLDGDRVRRESAPPGPVLWWVTGFANGDLYAAGAKGRVIARIGGAWREESTGLGDDAVLFGVWGAAPDDLWAVGADGVVLRSSGDGVWRRIVDPAIPSDARLFKVWGASASDVHVVGSGGLALHFDGTRFTHIDTGAPDLFTVHGKVGGPILAVGGYDRGVVLRYDGGRWIDDGAPGGSGLSGVFVGDDGTAIAVGLDGRVIARDLAGTWSDAPVALGSKIFANDLHAAVIVGADRWVVGGKLVRGREGLVATDHRPLPALEVGPPPALDAGTPDASPADAEPLDAGIADADSRDTRAPTDAEPSPDAKPTRDARVLLDAELEPEAGIDLDAATIADASPRDAAPRDAAAPDATPPDTGALPGLGELCPTYLCADGLVCRPVAYALDQPYCTHPCTTASDCADYGAPACCFVPGPQSVDTYCEPISILSSGMCP